MDRVERPGRQLAQLGHLGADLGRVLEALEHLQADDQRGQRLAGVVVQLAGDPLALFLLGADDLLEQLGADLLLLAQLLGKLGQLAIAAQDLAMGGLDLGPRGAQAVEHAVEGRGQLADLIAGPDPRAELEIAALDGPDDGD